MSTPKQRRRNISANRLEPIDWHEFANDAVLNGNMSTLYNRPPTEDSTAYASPEALVEIEKRVGRPVEGAVVVGFDAAVSHVVNIPTVGGVPTVGTETICGGTEQESLAPSLSIVPADIPTVCAIPTVGLKHTVGAEQESPAPSLAVLPTDAPTVGAEPTVGIKPTVGMDGKRRVKPIRDVQDALTLAGHVLYKAMYGAPDGAKSKSCTKGYRQLAAETYLDKDTVRDLISEFKDKGIARETSTYDPDTRSAKTYEVLSYKAILQIWRDVGIVFVTTGRKRPLFCTAQGELLTIVPTVGIEPTVPRRTGGGSDRPTVGPLISALPERSEVVQGDRQQAAEVIQALQQITGNPVDQEAADRLVRNCSIEAPDCTIEEIVEFAWSKAFLCRSGKIENPIGFLITQVPKHFQREAFTAYRKQKQKEVEAAAVLAARDEERRRESEQELAEIE